MAKGHYSGAYDIGVGLMGLEEGITSADWSLDAKRWVNLVCRRICLSGNRINVTFT